VESRLDWTGCGPGHPFVPLVALQASTGPASSPPKPKTTGCVAPSTVSRRRAGSLTGHLNCAWASVVIDCPTRCVTQPA